ncbi:MULTISPECIES: FadR/GntR family transcriptional regulator [Neorhizobium]|uniref:Putative L-lactate dehydrogenase operon regulatory protein n=1 Tax=Neorhizobium galegae bv. officinalis TaxID=323656 RepID=A0A0T7GR06_NEOGA|nr:MULTISPECIES: FCD domain-containing protein [Neorhizobium]CDZ49692.1 Putative L-lactate dehydrogenase operon regulatory protein [Neorhizobium galegae bv. officinalis]
MDEIIQQTRAVKDLSSHVLARLEAMLEAPAWQGGGRLPPEAELARQFGVSRPVLRKALVKMRDAGRIISRRGSANFVQPRADVVPSAADIQGLSIQTVFDMKRCMRFRQVVECAAAEDAARLCDPEGIRGIEDAHRRMLTLPPGEGVFEADFAFHMAVAQATRNPYFPFALGTMRNQIKLMMEFTRKLQERPPDQVAPRVVEEHQRVLEAIKAGDPVQAHEVMSFHMSQSVIRLLVEDGA